MEKDILFDSVEQKEATERVLATVRVKTITKELEELTEEIIKYAGNIDKILERNSLEPRYFGRLEFLETLSLIKLDEDLEDIDFRVKEVVEDFIKRINTRINLIKNNNELIKELISTYKIDESKMVEDIKLVGLDKREFEFVEAE